MTTAITQVTAIAASDDSERRDDFRDETDTLTEDLIRLRDFAKDVETTVASATTTAASATTMATQSAILAETTTMATSAMVTETTMTTVLALATETMEIRMVTAMVTVTVTGTNEIDS